MEIKLHPMGDYQTNCYIVTIDNKDIIIDPGVGALSWIEANAKNPIAVLNTHGHFDHVWSNQIVKETFDIKLYTPKDDSFMLTLNPYNMGMPPSYADVLVNPDEEIELEGIKVKFHHFPGHTPGCSVIEIENSLFSGDFIFKGTIGRFDFPNSDAKLMKQSINKILTWKNNFHVYPGHGDKTTLQNEIETLKQWERHI
ncbi:MBL fold metallo-hydrolase [Aliarcobacter butzleri]|uniref:Beta-lactamase-like protein n=5 Tax=Aliarcobacter butzleri TaxID=28197 RepID=A8EUD2_ALIB4|nr:MBL fold metallo-hydrolase [Aliarcobacter butzleri]ABV67556.1 beta-lactamase-like protein [Aliarcobacter butzleri RM4018]AGR77590.1 metallo-beta-lactamase family protein [Aliarcobacter butzleri 7h1h]EFU69084.1 metallo-beta-lactamase [Aliarcobacter butzleri JV22]KLD97224.1 beta-lactamase [Aliarcobacter butzleri L349]KLE09705.1 beta-lactamase [Aliarcobacter butzleri L355]